MSNLYFFHVYQIGTCVTMNGYPQPRIIWFKNDQPIPEVKDTKASMYPMIPTVKIIYIHIVCVLTHLLL